MAAATSSSSSPSSAASACSARSPATSSSRSPAVAADLRRAPRRPAHSHGHAVRLAVGSSRWALSDSVGRMRPLLAGSRCSSSRRCCARSRRRSTSSSSCACCRASPRPRASPWQCHGGRPLRDTRRRGSSRARDGQPPAADLRSLVAACCCGRSWRWLFVSCRVRCGAARRRRARLAREPAARAPLAGEPARRFVGWVSVRDWASPGSHLGGPHDRRVLRVSHRCLVRAPGRLRTVPAAFGLLFSVNAIGMAAATYLNTCCSRALSTYLAGGRSWLRARGLSAWRPRSSAASVSWARVPLFVLVSASGWRCRLHGARPVASSRGAGRLRPGTHRAPRSPPS